MPFEENDLLPAIVLTLDEWGTAMAALDVAIEAKKVTIANAVSIKEKLDTAIDQWKPLVWTR